MSSKSYQTFGNISEDSETYSTSQSYYGDVDQATEQDARHSNLETSVTTAQQNEELRHSNDLRNENSRADFRESGERSFQGQESLGGRSMNAQEIEEGQDATTDNIGTFDPEQSLLQIPAASGVSGDRNDSSLSPPTVLELAGIGRHGSVYYRAPPRARSSGPFRRGKSALGQPSQIPETEDESQSYGHDPVQSHFPNSLEQGGQHRDNSRSRGHDFEDLSRGQQQANPFERPNNDSMRQPGHVPGESATRPYQKAPETQRAHQNPYPPTGGSVPSQNNAPQSRTATDPRGRPPMRQSPQPASQVQVPHSLRAGPPSSFQDPGATSSLGAASRPQDPNRLPQAQANNMSRTQPVQPGRMSPLQQDPRSAGRSGSAVTPAAQNGQHSNPAPQMPARSRQPSSSLPPNQPQRSNAQKVQGDGLDPANSRMGGNMQSSDPAGRSARGSTEDPHSAQTLPPSTNFPKAPLQQQQQGPQHSPQSSDISDVNRRGMDSNQPRSHLSNASDQDHQMEKLNLPSKDGMTNRGAEEVQPSGTSLSRPTQADPFASESSLTSEILISKIISGQQPLPSALTKPESSKMISEGKSPMIMI